MFGPVLLCQRHKAGMLGCKHENSLVRQQRLQRLKQGPDVGNVHDGHAGNRFAQGRRPLEQEQAFQVGGVRDTEFNLILERPLAFPCQRNHGRALIKGQDPCALPGHESGVIAVSTGDIQDDVTGLGREQLRHAGTDNLSVKRIGIIAHAGVPKGRVRLPYAQIVHGKIAHDAFLHATCCVKFCYCAGETGVPSITSVTSVRQRSITPFWVSST